MALVAGECIVFDQATPILELLTGSRERPKQDERPTDAEVCEAILADVVSREHELVAASFGPGFSPPRHGSMRPRVDSGRFGAHVHTLRIGAHRFMDGAVLYDLATFERNVVLRKVDAHWEIVFAQDVSYEGHARVTRDPFDERAPFDREILERHVPELGTPCPRS